MCCVEVEVKMYIKVNHHPENEALVSEEVDSYWDWWKSNSTIDHDGWPLYYCVWFCLHKFLHGKYKKSGQKVIQKSRKMIVQKSNVEDNNINCTTHSYQSLCIKIVFTFFLIYAFFEMAHFPLHWWASCFCFPQFPLTDGRQKLFIIRSVFVNSATHCFLPAGADSQKNFPLGPGISFD